MQQEGAKTRRSEVFGFVTFAAERKLRRGRATASGSNPKLLDLRVFAFGFIASRWGCRNAARIAEAFVAVVGRCG